MPEAHGHVGVFSFSRTGTDVASPSPTPVEGMFVEQERIRHALGANGGNIAKTAGQLGLTRQTLYRRLKKYGFR